MKKYKIYKKNNYIVVTDNITSETFYGRAKDVMVDKSNTNRAAYRFFNILDLKEGTSLTIDQFLKEDGSPYTSDEFDIFYTQNTGNFNGAGATAQYKFLLSQSGGDDPQTATSGSLTQGVTYEIVAFETGDDFIPSGAPNNDVGTKWIANGVAPTWGNGSEMGWNNGAPFIYAQISNYTSYPFWFSFNSNAYYQAEKTGGFDISKTWYVINEQSDDSSDPIGKTRMKLSGDTLIFQSTDSAGVESNNILDKTPVEITIKP